MRCEDAGRNGRGSLGWGINLPFNSPCLSALRGQYSFFDHEGTKNTKRKEFAALQGFGGRLVTLGVHSSRCIARKGAKSQRHLGCELNLVLPGLRGES